MLSKNPEERPSIAMIKDHPYYKGPVPSNAEIITDGNYRRSVIA
jgi:hypothetical protein